MTRKVARTNEGKTDVTFVLRAPYNDDVLHTAAKQFNSVIDSVCAKYRIEEAIEAVEEPSTHAFVIHILRSKRLEKTLMIVMITHLQGCAGGS